MTAAHRESPALLQNHPGEPGWPVRPTRFSQLTDQKRALVHGVGTMGALILLLGIFMAGLSTEGPEFAPQVAISGAITCLVGPHDCRVGDNAFSPCEEGAHS